MDTKLLEKVKQASYFLTPEDIKIFGEGVWKLAEEQDEETFQNLIVLFDDQTNYPEVMFSLVHALESYPDEVYITLILKTVNILTNVYKEWYSRLIIRILNEDSCRPIFIKKLNQLDSVSANKIIQIIKEQYPEKLNILGTKE